MVARRFLDMRFAMGATVVLRQDDLTRMGGFAAVADYLADDYQLGARIADLGLRVHLSDYVVSVILGATTFREEWDREVRWARCTHISRPWEYPGLLLSFSTPLAALLVFLSDFGRLESQVLALSVLLRWLVAWMVTGYIGDWESRRWLAWLPVRDALSVLVWLVGGLGRRVIWRGEAFLVQPDGRMQPLPEMSLLARVRRRAW
jgi:ceramide glucosyltransferase